MRVKRQKNFRRSLRFYRLAFNMQQPYKVIVDGPFLTNALQEKIHVREHLLKILGGKVTPMVTTCVLNELRSLGNRGAGAASIATDYYRVKCGHTHNIGAAKCIREQIGSSNDRKLFVATQDSELGLDLRKIPGVPIIRLNGQVPYLEEPSAASKQNLKVDEEKKLQPSRWELPKLVTLEQQKALEAAKAERKPAKRKGPKGPNPLSCLKSKKNKQADGASISAPSGSAATSLAVDGGGGQPPTAMRVRARRLGTVTWAAAEAKAAGPVVEERRSLEMAVGSAAADDEEDAAEPQKGGGEGGSRRGKRRRRA